jgi:hypothetical protein
METCARCGNTFTVWTGHVCPAIRITTSNRVELYPTRGACTCACHDKAEGGA